MQWSKLVVYFSAWQPISSVSWVICGLSGPAGRRTRDYPLQGNTTWRKCLHWHLVWRVGALVMVSKNVLSIVVHLSFHTSLQVKLKCSVLHCTGTKKTSVTSGDRDTEGLSRFLPSRAKCPWQQVNRGDQYKVHSLEKRSLLYHGSVNYSPFKPPDKHLDKKEMISISTRKL